MLVHGDGAPLVEFERAIAIDVRHLEYAICLVLWELVLHFFKALNNFILCKYAVKIFIQLSENLTHLLLVFIGQEMDLHELNNDRF